MLKAIQAFFSGSKNTDILRQYIQEGAQLIDVRTPAEYASGHVPSSKNVPLDTLPSRIGEFHSNTSYIVFCRSGNRSGQALHFLQANGIQKVVNGGTWQSILELKQ